MTLFLDGGDVRELATHDVAMAAARTVVAAHRDGRVALPPRLDVDLPSGFLRVMPAALEPYMGLKVMTLAEAHGTRYLILVYRQATGELLAVLDADEVTRLRTAATTAVAGELLLPDGADRVGLVGSGFEAEGHLRTFSRQWPLREALVFSPSEERRERFAARMTDELGFPVRPVATVEAAVGDAPVSILCTKSKTPVVDGAAFPRGATVLSIGSTRPDLRELDQATLRRAAVLLVDDARQVMLECGDVGDALQHNALEEDRIVGMAEWTGLDGRVTSERDLVCFKSVGTAVQDLALAGELIGAATAAGRGRQLGELTRLKAFSAPAAETLSSLVEGGR